MFHLNMLKGYKNKVSHVGAYCWQLVYSNSQFDNQGNSMEK